MAEDDDYANTSNNDEYIDATNDATNDAPHGSGLNDPVHDIPSSVPGKHMEAATPDSLSTLVLLLLACSVGVLCTGLGLQWWHTQSCAVHPNQECRLTIQYAVEAVQNPVSLEQEDDELPQGGTSHGTLHGTSQDTVTAASHQVVGEGLVAPDLHPHLT
jgi:hypothetical protein